MVIMSIAGLAGCMTQQSYEGPRRQASEVARVSGDLAVTAGAPITVILRQVDGHTVPFGSNSVDVLPGEHTFLVDCRIAETRSITRVEITADVLPGARYRLVAETGPGLRECTGVHLEAND